MYKLKERLKRFFKWIKKECKDYRTFIILLVVVFVVHTPIWGGILLYKIFKLKWGLAMATTVSVFWLGPFTPFFPICIAITFGIKKILEKNRRKN